MARQGSIITVVGYQLISTLQNNELTTWLYFPAIPSTNRTRLGTLEFVSIPLFTGAPVNPLPSEQLVIAKFPIYSKGVYGSYAKPPGNRTVHAVVRWKFAGVQCIWGTLP